MARFTAKAKSYSHARDFKGQLRRELAGELRAADRAALAALRAEIRDARAARRTALSSIVLECRAARLLVRERAAERRAAALAELRAARAAETLAARSSCSSAKSAAGVELAKRRGAYASETERRRHQRAAARLVKPARGRSSSEARAESDDAVESNLPAELVPIWRVQKRHIRASGQRSRTEAFLEWAQESPDAVWQIRNENTERELRKLLATERAFHRETKKATRYKRPAAALAADLADVPF